MMSVMKGLSGKIVYGKPHCHIKKASKQMKTKMDGYYSVTLKLSCSCICGDIIARTGMNQAFDYMTIAQMNYRFFSYICIYHKCKQIRKDTDT